MRETAMYAIGPETPSLSVSSFLDLATVATRVVLPMVLVAI